ncbi:MAG: hypothetical protein GQ544_05250 [Candidatus Aminicenantes bacterium]|nr:hypothetical protein [Candidatus Aminicenantes bacterium]
MRRLQNILIILCLWTIPGLAFDNTPIDKDDQAISGVKFQDMALADALKKAGQESKLVLIDVFSPT